MKPLLILAAEDNEADVMLFEEALDHHHIEHELRVVTDGQAALEYIAKMGPNSATPCPDLMLLDLNLPKAEGATILGKFREHPACSNTPVIVVTSSDADRDRAKVATYGETGYFRKPSNYEEFMKLGDLIRQAVKTR